MSVCGAWMGWVGLAPLTPLPFLCNQTRPDQSSRSITHTYIHEHIWTGTGRQTGDRAMT